LPVIGVRADPNLEAIPNWLSVLGVRENPLIDVTP
jgi:hypothetical protein